MIRLFPLFLLTLLTACGVATNSVDFPPERPESIINGQTTGGALINAQATLYAFRDGKKQEKLASAEIDENGAFQIIVKAKSQAIWVEIEGGSYKEALTKEQIPLSEEHRLSTLAYYQTGQNLGLELSPFSHLATALIQYQIANGIVFDQAFNEASPLFEQLMGFNVLPVKPELSERQKTAEDESDKDNLNLLYQAALSGLSAWFANENGHKDQTVYNTLSLLNIMHSDLFADGVFDGFGIDESNEPQQLAVGNVLLSSNVYRLGFAQNLISSTKDIELNETQDRVQIAKNFLVNPSQLLAEDDSELAQRLAPKIFSVEQPQADINGSYNFRVLIQSKVEIEQVGFDIDDEPALDSINTGTSSFSINSRNYSDGEHMIGISVTDILGSTSRLSFPVTFNNTQIGVISPLLTNQPDYLLFGEYIANNLNAILVNDEEVEQVNENFWASIIALEPGNNEIKIEIVDDEDYREQIIVNVTLDLAKPSIETDALHADARFSDMQGGFVVQAMADENTDVPLYFESNRLALDGLMLNRETLNANNIPYFAFEVFDTVNGADKQLYTDLNVVMSYARNVDAFDQEIELFAIGDEYLIPLVTEMLGVNWYQSTDEDEHRIKISVTDKAGNVQEKIFRFKAAIYVPEIVVTQVQDVGEDVIAAFEFSDRQLLNSRQFNSTNYEFENTSSKGFYIQLKDESDHYVDLLVEEMVRKHLYRTRTITEWRASSIINTSFVGECPTALPMSPITEIYNYIGNNQWQLETLPDDSLSQIFEVDSNVLPAAPENIDWHNGEEQFASEVRMFNIPFPNNRVLTYEDDLLVDADLIGQPSFVRNWQLVERDGSDNIINIETCPDAHFFQERTRFVNESFEDYPKNISQDFMESFDFSNDETLFQVYDNDEQVFIDADADGWFYIPAGHRVEVKKFVRLPELPQSYNDLAVADAVSFNSYTAQQLDKSLTWYVNRSIEISTRFNVDAETQRQQSTGVGEMVYSLSR